jgi:hypothetical protein
LGQPKQLTGKDGLQAVKVGMRVAIQQSGGKVTAVTVNPTRKKKDKK